MQSCLVLVLNLGRLFPFGVLSPNMLALIHFLDGLVLSSKLVFLRRCLEALVAESFCDEECFPFAFSHEQQFRWV